MTMQTKPKSRQLRSHRCDKAKRTNSGRMRNVQTSIPLLVSRVR